MTTAYMQKAFPNINKNATQWNTMMKTGLKNVCNTLSKIKLPPFLYYYIFAIWITQDYKVKCSSLYLAHFFFHSPYFTV